ncbi:hypothetical protein E2562_027364 [Oryza meyeriana var. granulata]|uniref:DUF1685 domain-containing protein n=1 Tax=Oryza meyeriana var. granulata TaxID=110450 RepID=A0A6G1C9T8_9ORYZ|nr:hypothetical protein E2562_027364 [Oryza meyeriana var. granulata]
MERPREPMAAAAEDVLALYDASWFHRLLLLSPPPAAVASAGAVAAVAPASPAAQPLREEEMRRPEKEREVKRSPSGMLRHRRTRSDEATAAAFEAGLEPLRIPNGNHRAARLETILSGKDGLASPQPQPLPERRRPAVRRPGRRRQRRGRSMSELEFEEVKGLQDLGFTFSEDDVDAELASIVPGLRRRRSDEDDAIKATVTAASAEEEAGRRAGSAPAGASSSAPRRPYLSEAWDEEEEGVRRMLRNWRIPPAGDGADLKEHLRLWAHTVASAVR